MRLRTLLALGVVLLPLGACTDQPTAPATPKSAQVDLVTPVPTGGVRCGESFIVTAKATNPNGKGTVAGLLLNFNVTAGGGSMFGGAALTNDKGLASDIWTLGRADEPNTMAVRAVSALGAGTTYATMSLNPVSKIAFTGFDLTEYKSQIYLMSADGSDPLNLTNNLGVSDATPVWSPDGSKIAFTRTVSGDYHNNIWAMNADGTNPVKLTSGDWENYPAWSPDGRRIAFSRNLEGHADIFVMNADGTNLVRLPTGPAFDTHPVWSPDGRKIAFMAGAPYHVVVMNADGSNPVALTPSDVDHESLAWSPDGRSIVFQRWDYSGYWKVWIMGADGSNQTLLATGADWAGGVAWSPDGRRIAFMKTDGMYVMDADGSNQTKIRDGVAMEPAWSGCSAR